MHSALSTTYILPAIFLNPVLFLHSLNTILSRILPPIVVASTTQPQPYSQLGPSANHPHLNIHASANLCWSYTALMVCAQLVAFGTVSQSRAQGRKEHERKMKKKEAELAVTHGNGYGHVSSGKEFTNGHCKGASNGGTYGNAWHDEYQMLPLQRTETETTEEMIL